MPSQEEIQDQLGLLTAHRRTLAGYLKQLANLGSQFAPPSLFNGIREARDNIKRIKKTLRDWNIPYENHPDDTNEVEGL